MNIVFSSDENYAPFLATTMVSILLNSAADDQLSFYVLDGGLSKLSKAKIGALKRYRNFTLTYIPFDYSLVEHCPTMAHFSKAAYFRFYIADMIPDANRLLYLDVDLIITTSLAALYNLDMGKNSIAAVPRNKSDRLGTKGQLLFNSGVMLIDAAAWRKWNIAEKLISTTDEIIDKIEMVDQDVLNYFFQDKYTHIDKEWNVRQHDIEKSPTTKIAHFSGGKFERMSCMLLFHYLSKTEFASFGTKSYQEALYHYIYEASQKKAPANAPLQDKSIAFVLTKMLDMVCLQSLITHFFQADGVRVGVYLISENADGSLDAAACTALQDMHIPYSTDCTHIHEEVVFLANPYLDPLFYADLTNAGKRIAYIPYGSSISGEEYSTALHYNSTIHNLAWRIYVINDFFANMYKKHCTLFQEGHVKSIRTTPKFDQITHAGTTAPKAPTIFLWNIHFNSISTDHDKNTKRTWSAFYVYCNTILDFFTRRGDLSLILRPHHNIFRNGKYDVINALTTFEALPNVTLEPAGVFGYGEALDKADAYISDISTMIMDMAITGKPVILLTYKNSCRWNEFGERVFSRFTYRVSSTTEFTQVASSLSIGSDPLWPQRSAALHDEELFSLSRPAHDIIAHDLFQRCD